MMAAAPIKSKCCKVRQCCAPYMQHHSPPFRGGLVLQGAAGTIGGAA